MSKEHAQPTLNVDIPTFVDKLEKSLEAKNLQVVTWDDIDPQAIYQQLENPNWAPWLEASIDSIAGRASVFSEGQLLLVNKDGIPMASLSINRINWDGNPDTLPTWDEIAGDPTDYSQTYQPEGNTYVLMSMNVSPAGRGQRLPTALINKVQIMAYQEDIEYIVGSFRPNEFGKKKQESQQALDFWEYVTEMKTTRVDEQGVFGEAGSEVDLPLDAWLRSLSWVGMNILVEDPSAMVVTVSLEEFEHYKQTYKPDSWWQDESGLWHCSEVGCWLVDEASKSATYVESNVFGSLPVLADADAEAGA